MDDIVRLYRCTLCQGLFQKNQDLLSHRKKCDGTVQNSDAALFACSKEILLQQNENVATEEGEIIQKERDHDYIINKQNEEPATEVHDLSLKEVKSRRKTRKEINLIKISTEPSLEETAMRQQDNLQNKEHSIDSKENAKRIADRLIEPKREPDETSTVEHNTQDLDEEVKSCRSVTFSRITRTGRRTRVPQKYRSEKELILKRSDCVLLDTGDVKPEVEENVMEDSNEERCDSLEGAKEKSKMEGQKTKNAADREKEKSALEEKYKDFVQKTTLPSGREELVYQCPDCAKKIKHVGFFKRHMIGCHPPTTEGEDGSVKLWKCAVCDYKTEVKSRYVQHQYKHKKSFMCEVCSRQFSLRRDLETHMYSHKDEKPFRCNICDYATRFRSALKEHARKHSGQLLQCGVEGCKFSTPYDWALRCHKNSKHVCCRKFKCDICSYETTTRSCLIRHTKTHLGIKQYKCSLCAQTAVSKHEIVRHMRRHTKEKIYFCDRCNFSTSYSSGLKIHLMQHLGVKPWQCSLCGFNSITKQRVQQHQTTRHPNLKGQVVNLGLKLDVSLSQYRRKPSECYTVTVVNEGEEKTTFEPITLQHPESTVESEILVETMEAEVTEEALVGGSPQQEQASEQVHVLSLPDGTSVELQPFSDFSAAESRTIIVQSTTGDSSSEIHYLFPANSDTTQNTQGENVELVYEEQI